MGAELSSIKNMPPAIAGSIDKTIKHGVRNARPKGKAYKLFDGGGLYLEATPAGKVSEFEISHIR